MDKLDTLSGKYTGSYGFFVLGKLIALRGWKESPA